MKKTYILGSIAAAVALSTSGFAKDHKKHKDHCVVMNADKVNVVAAGKGDCAIANGSCAGKNTAKQEGAWIKADKETCQKINEAIKAGKMDAPELVAAMPKLEASLIEKK